LRVKESAWMWCEKRPNGKTKTGRDKWHFVPLDSAPIYYAADHPKKPPGIVFSPYTGNEWGWRLKIGRFLPAWASRITLKITGISVERLHDCSEQDAMAEGCETDIGEGAGLFWFDGLGVNKETGRQYAYDAKEAYSWLWESINGSGSWDANPLVWVIEFEVQS
jgi:hypothetical protein